MHNNRYLCDILLIIVVVCEYKNYNQHFSAQVFQCSGSGVHADDKIIDQLNPVMHWFAQVHHTACYNPCKQKLLIIIPVQ